MSPCQATALITAGALSALAQSKLAGTPSALAGNAQRPAMMRRTRAAPASRRSGLLVMNDELAVLAQVLRAGRFAPAAAFRSEEHTSDIQALMRTSYAVFCLKKKKN